MIEKQNPQSIDVDPLLRVVVDEAKCKTVGECVRIAPEIFTFTTGSKKATVKMALIPPGLFDKVQEAVEQCPYNAIVINRHENRKGIAT